MRAEQAHQAASGRQTDEDVDQDAVKHDATSQSDAHPFHAEEKALVMVSR